MPTILERQEQIIESLLDQVPTINPFLYLTDSYKVSHIKFEVEGVKEIYSNFTPRFCKYIAQLIGDTYDQKYVVFGLQWAIMRLHVMAKKGFFDRPKDEVIQEIASTHKAYINNETIKHFEDLHDLGYLPIVIKVLREGSVVNVGVPFLTIRNTLPNFEWLPNYLEPILSTDIWKELTVATVARAYRLISNDFALQTVGNTDGVEFQNHDFSLRGQSGFESSAINGVAFLLSSCGTDNIPALWAADKFYQSKVGGPNLLAASVPAGEHSVTTLGILTQQRIAADNGEEIDLVEAEYRYKAWLLTQRFPTGIVSDVADSYDYWSHISINVLKLKDIILSRDGKYVVRGDSGNPVDIICGLKDVDIDKAVALEVLSLPIGVSFMHNDCKYLVLKRPEVTKDTYLPFSELLRKGFIKKVPVSSTYPVIVVAAEAKGTIEVLWDIFGGTITDKGYKLLNSHIGMIYGDGITISRQKEIFERLKAKGFASTNIVLGCGSYSLNYLGRDHLGMAIKATNALVEIDGNLVDLAIYKEPKTDTSKKSAKGLLCVNKDEEGNYILIDSCSRKREDIGELTSMYMNGQFHMLTTVDEIRTRMWG